MKNIFNSLFFFLTFTAHAQKNMLQAIQEGESKFIGGAILGMNASQVDGDAFVGFHKAGLNTGMSVYWFFTKDLAWRMEFLYSQKGSRGVHESYSTAFGSYYSKYKLKLNYIEVPLSINYRFRDKYLLSAGVSLNVLLKTDEAYDEAGYQTQYVNQKEIFNSNFFDAMLGVGMFFRNNFILEARYQYGVTPVRNYNNVIPFTAGMGEQHQFNNMASFRLVYLF